MAIKATIFEFTSYQFEPDKKRVVFNYKTTFEDRQPILFTETIILPQDLQIAHIEQGLLQHILEALHLVLGISYYKFYCATKISLPYQLSKGEASFWTTVYKKGLGEFFYKNKLSPNISPKFFASKDARKKSYSLKNTGRCLVGIGGGKDSIVAAELLKEHGCNPTGFVVSNRQQEAIIDDTIKILGIEKIQLQRILDPKVHEKHLYDGHVPVSAMYAFLGIFTSATYGYSYVAMGNEYSSNFGNTTYRGLVINHQWSKSFEFEKLFQDYVGKFLTDGITYFSLMRRFHEIRIVKMFSKYPNYFQHFSSCNQNFKMAGASHKGLWCGHCAKCVFAFTLLSAFISKKELLNIFGKNLYEDELLLPLFKDILGFGSMKPFDCVGTFQEAQTALYLAKKKFTGDFIVRQLGKRAKYDMNVFSVNNESLIPSQFMFLGIESALILGFGKEGKITKSYLKKFYPNLKIGTADSSQKGDYLKKQQDFDLAIKTPGIKKELVNISYTTATNIFFSKIKGQNLIIAVTGSKGKSTTASLIFEILKTAGKNVQLLGNIGKPMLEALLNPIDSDTIFVVELSSYQLDDIADSPDIAVVTNLFPEHMDFHGNLKKYYEAKKRIIKEAQTFIYNPENREMKKWLKEYQGNAIAFSKKIFVSHLLGEHNKTNIGAAVAVAETLHIPEEKIKEAIENFGPLPHRLEFVGEFKKILFYDDAISTTPESTIMAIKALPNIDTIFLGGQDRGYDFSLLEKTIKKYNISNIVLFPDSGSKIIKNKHDLRILKTSSMKEAVKFAYQHTKPGHVCLLSCASPSYSLWKNFEEKGDQFKAAVKKLSQ